MNSSQPIQLDITADELIAIGIHKDSVPVILDRCEYAVKNNFVKNDIDHIIYFVLWSLMLC